MDNPDTIEVLLMIAIVMAVITAVLIPLAWAADKFDEWVERREYEKNYSRVKK